MLGGLIPHSAPVRAEVFFIVPLLYVVTAEPIAGCTEVYISLEDKQTLSKTRVK